MNLLVVGNNLVHLMYMMPVVESLVTSTHGKSLYYGTTSAIKADYNMFVSDNTIKEFIKKNIIITGNRNRLDRNIFRIIKSHNPDLIFWWNGIGVGIDVVNEVKRSRTVIFCEVGFFPQREHVYLDTKGINYLSSIRDRESPDISDKERKKLQTKISHYKKHALREDDSFTMEDYIFVPLQLEYDMQIINFSPKFEKMNKLVDFVSKTFPAERIIVKHHPLDRRSYSSKWDNVEIVKDVNTHLLIKNSKYVIGINSTVLLESLLYDKVVGAFGKGIFTGENVLLEAHDDINKIKDIYNFKIDTEDTKDNFLYDLIFNCQIKVGDVNEDNIVEKYHVNPNEVMAWVEKNGFLSSEKITKRKIKRDLSRFKTLFATVKDYLKKDVFR